MTRVFAAAGSVFFAFVVLMAASPALAGVGVLGDSLSDEYLGTTDIFGTQTDLPALNWVQLLSDLRGVDFGALETDPAVRGEPRNEGYDYNWARAGATAVGSPIFLPASSSITNQATALAPDVTSGDVDIVSINIGHNDYFFRDYLDGFVLGTIRNSSFSMKPDSSHSSRVSSIRFFWLSTRFLPRMPVRELRFRICLLELWKTCRTSSMP